MEDLDRVGRLEEAIESMRHQLAKSQVLEESIAKLRAEYAGSWALHTKEDFELGFAREIKNDLQGTIFKWAFGALVLLLGVGAIFIRYSVTHVFHEENAKLVSDFSRNYEDQTALLAENFEWRRFHDYGKDYAYLAEMYFDSPVASPRKEERIAEHLDNSRQYFSMSLRHGTQHGSTHWELGELYFKYPIRLHVQGRVNAQKALWHYDQASSLYSQLEIEKGWRAQCYMNIGEVYLYLADKGIEPEKNRDSARVFLDKARDDFAGVKGQMREGVQADIERLQQLSVNMRWVSKSGAQVSN